MRRSLLPLIPLIAGLVAACTPLPQRRAWTVADLRLLDPLDASSPGTEILAVYTRTTAMSVEIRVDLLDISLADDTTIEILLYDNQDYAEHPLLIRSPSQGFPSSIQPGVGEARIRSRITRDPLLDTVTFSLNRALIGDRYRVDVFTYAGRVDPGNGPDSPVDEARGACSEALPPGERAPLLLAFQDAFPAVTPAQALRRWDGAHTGPSGGRHGLKYLLDAAGRYGLPVALLDLKVPASLAALDTLGAVSRLQDLSRRGLLVLPDVANAGPPAAALGVSRRAAAGFGLPASPFVYAPRVDGADPVLPGGWRARFVSLPDASHLARAGTLRLVPLPAAQAAQATETGPALEIRRALVAAALSSDPADLLVLGGSLPDSTWGIPEAVGASFAWLAGHPWVKVLNGYDLLTFPTGQDQALLDFEPWPVSSWTAVLQGAPQNAAADLAWQAYLTLTAPAADPQLERLRLGYLGQIGDLLAAAGWVQDPQAKADCSADPDRDGRPECILSDAHYFAILESDGARLSFLFYLDGSGSHQLVAPTSQFALGLSDPSEWRPELGEAGDPSVIPGAFTDDGAAWEGYRPAVEDSAVVFSSPDGTRVKTYRLTGMGLEVTYRVAAPLTTSIPLVADPQVFYFGPSAYQAALGVGSWVWGPAGGTHLEVRTDAALSAQGFNASLPFLAHPEDPDLNYPPGHYLPFPFSVVAIQGAGSFHVWISVK